LIAKEEEIVKMVDDSACEDIGTGIVKVTERDGTVLTLKVVWYVPEARYNLISIKVLDEEGCWIQVQQRVVTISQDVRVILEEEKRGGLYKLKEGNSDRGGVVGIISEGSSSRGRVSRKTATECEGGQSVARRRKSAFRKGPRWLKPWW